MKDKLRPGYTSYDDLWDVKFPRIEKHVNMIISFLDLPEGAQCLDWGAENPRMNYMKKKMGIKVDQFAPPDLNFASYKGKRYDAVFAFYIVEHLQNALWNVRQMKNAVKEGGSIYIALPENPMWLWGEDHYFEMRYNHFVKWILNPLGLKVVGNKKIFFVENKKAYLIGARPLLRILRGEDTWRAMARSMLCVRYRIYEIKKS